MNISLSQYRSSNHGFLNLPIHFVHLLCQYFHTICLMNDYFHCSDDKRGLDFFIIIFIVLLMIKEGHLFIIFIVLIILSDLFAVHMFHCFVHCCDEVMWLCLFAVPVCDTVMTDSANETNTSSIIVNYTENSGTFSDYKFSLSLNGVRVEQTRKRDAVRQVQFDNLHAGTRYQIEVQTLSGNQESQPKVITVVTGM